MRENPEILEILRLIQNTPYPVTPRAKQFRVSSLPFCGIVFVLDKPETTEDFKTGFFTQQGHALHSLWQNAATHAMPKNLIGDWQCTKILKRKESKKSNTIIRCNRQVKFTSFDKAKAKPCIHSKTVSREECHASQYYNELELDWLGLSGHTDFLYKSKKGYHLVDFKTTGLFLFDKPDIAIRLGYYPSKKYIVQLETYVLMLEQRYKIKIIDYTIAYISRDRAIDTKEKPALKLFTYKVTDNLRKKRKNITLKYMKRHTLAKKWLEAKSDRRKVLGEKMWETRPCHNRQDYKNHMEYAFFDGCPHLVRCMSGKLRSQLLK